MMKSIEPQVAPKLPREAVFAAIWGVVLMPWALRHVRVSGLSAAFNGKLYKKMNKAKLDCDP
jgi:hypothetical protein